MSKESVVLWSATESCGASERSLRCERTNIAKNRVALSKRGYLLKFICRVLCTIPNVVCFVFNSALTLNNDQLNEEPSRRHKTIVIVSFYSPCISLQAPHDFLHIIYCPYDSVFSVLHCPFLTYQPQPCITSTQLPDTLVCLSEKQNKTKQR